MGLSRKSAGLPGDLALRETLFDAASRLGEFVGRGVCRISSEIVYKENTESQTNIWFLSTVNDRTASCFASKRIENPRKEVTASQSEEQEVPCCGHRNCREKDAYG